MQVKAFEDLYNKYQDAETSPATEKVEKIIMRLEQSFTYYYYIVVDGVKVGAIRVVDEKEQGKLKRISPVFIMKQYRGKGYAQEAMKAVEKIHGENNGVSINYIDSDIDFVLSFSRYNRNIMPNDDTINGILNGTISEGERVVLELLRNNKNITVKELAEVSDKSIRTINRIMSLLKSKGLIERIGSNKNGYWKVK